MTSNNGNVRYICDFNKPSFFRMTMHKKKNNERKNKQEKERKKSMAKKERERKK